MKLLFCGPLVPQAWSMDLSRDTAVTVWMEPLGFSGGCAGHRSGNGVQWPERTAVCVGKVPLGSQEPTPQTAATPSATAWDLGLSQGQGSQEKQNCSSCQAGFAAWVSRAVLFSSVLIYS